MPLSRREFIATSAATGLLAGISTTRGQSVPAGLPLSTTGAQDRQYWLTVVDRLARPILTALHENRLATLLASRKNARADRAQFAPLEALGRLLAGIAPFLGAPCSDPAEEKLRTELAEFARDGITRAVDPASPDFMNFNKSSQPVVDAAFLAHAALRAPKELWQKLTPAAQKNVVAALKSTRIIKPPQSNWLLFSAMVEALICHADESVGGGPAIFLPDTVETGFAKLEEWYKGDGLYGDGPNFHFDFYNSFVIHPLMIDLVETIGPQKPDWQKLRANILKRAGRYAAIQERLISPEGTYPPVGRSLVYRCGTFQLLAQIALRKELPAPLKPAQVRCALTAVIKKVIEFPNTFDDAGILTLGIAGSQPSLAETYISPGSTYLCSTALLPLGLPATDPFWSDPPTDWTSKQIFSGQPAPPIDHAITEP